MTSDARKKIAKAMSAAGEMRLALSGHVAHDVAARKWDDAAQDAHDAVCGFLETEARADAAPQADVLDDPNPASDEVKAFLADVVGVVEANSFEAMCLWQNYHESRRENLIPAGDDQ